MKIPLLLSFSLCVTMTLGKSLSEAFRGEWKQDRPSRMLSIISNQERAMDLIRSLIRMTEDKNKRFYLEDEDYDPSLESEEDKMKNIVSEDVKSVSKRKVFWQPLGYVPASLRMTGGSREQSGESSNHAGGNILRYG
ncbi:hypothetical protein FSP39_007914 [Pinctada imbricata]|uniref:Uncharacterized protein n=1 Tax=Pinctada imbricata TaxID=66713 RepID=A0AA88XLH0_PINIB|nr:hypothetical protein FSP39_007914 [Pinctada imbricata]